MRNEIRDLISEVGGQISEVGNGNCAPRTLANANSVIASVPQGCEVI